MICRLFGHKWKVVRSTLDLEKGAPMVVCERCDTNGWVV
jgi:hypothetical protein